MSLTPKKLRFSAEYLVDLNATKAAMRAGFSKKTAYSQGQRLLKDVEIQCEIQRLANIRSERTEITQDRVLLEIARLAFSDPRNVFDEDGKLKPIQRLPVEVAASISSVEVVTKTCPGTDPVEVEYVSKIKFWDKPKSVELAGKHLKLFTEKVEVSAPRPIELLITRQEKPR